MVQRCAPGWDAGMNGMEVCPRVGCRDEWYGGVPQGGMQG